MAGRRVLVTGATGFIGAHLVRRLIGSGARVHTVSRHPTPVRTTSDEQPTWWQCDLRDPAETMTLVRRLEPQVIVHLASEVAGTRDHRSVLSTMHSNLSSAVHLLSAAVEQPRTRVVLAGSMEEPALDTAPPSPYAAAKSAATGYGRMFHELWRLPVTTLRVAMVYGPGQHDRLKLVPYTITSLLSGESPRLSSGRRKIDWVYIDDVVDAFVKAIEAPAAEGAVLDIGSGTAVSIRDTVSRIVKLASPGTQPRYGAVADRQSDEACIADPTAAEEKIGWRASTPLDKGLARTVDWFRENQS